MKTLLKKISFHDGGKMVEKILITLGKKTKVKFIEALFIEWTKIKSENHQYMLSADIIRVANSMKIDVK